MFRRIVFLILLPVAALHAGDDARPGTVLDLTLHKAVSMALEHNYQIKVEAYSPLISRANVRSAAGAFDPQLTASYGRDESIDNTGFDALTGRGFSTITQTDSFAGGIGGLLPWGMTYGADFTTSKQRGTADNFTGEWDTGLRFSLRQPVLQGFGTDVNLAPLRIARRNQRISEWSMRATVIDVVTQVYTVYNNLHLAMEVLHVAEKTRALAKQLLDDNQRRLDVGTMSPLDVTQARAQYADREESVLLADRAVRDNENFLKQLVTDDVAGLLATQLRITPPPRAVVPPVDVEEAIRNAFEWRPDYRQALLNIEKLQISLVVAKNSVLPRLDLVGSLNLLGVDRQFAESLDNSLDRRASSWTAGAQFSLPIPNREARGRRDAVQLTKIQALVDLKRLEQDIIVAVDNAAGQIATTKQRIASTHESRILAQETLDAGEEKLKAGALTTFEVLDLQEKLAQAEVAELRAIADYNKSVAELDRQTGMALQNNGITLEK
jgi:outer membrane protein